MKLLFIGLDNSDKSISISIDNGITYHDYTVSFLKNIGIDIDPQNCNKIKVKGPASVLKNLNIVNNLKAVDANNILVTDTAKHTNFLDSVTGVIVPDGITDLSSMYSNNGYNPYSGQER